MEYEAVKVFGLDFSGNGSLVGHYILSENPQPVPEISELRNEKILDVLQDLKRAFYQEDDPIIKEQIKQAISKAESKIHSTYSEFLEKFSQAKLIPLKNKIYELNEKERRNEQQARKDNSEYTYTSYKPAYGQELQVLQRELQDLEIFQSQYKPDPHGYMAYLKKEFPNSIHGFYLKPLLAKIPQRTRKKHTYVVAQTGSGKSELLKVMAYGDIEAENRALVMIDPHGDMVEEIARFKCFSPENNLDNLVYIDPTLERGFTPSINPFQIDDTSEENISIVTEELNRVINILLQGATTQQMDSILNPCIAVLLRKKDGCFEDLQRFMDDENNSDLLELGRNSPNPQHARLFRGKFQSQDFRATKHGIYIRIQTLLNSPIFANLISHRTTIDLKTLIDQKKTILFKLSLGKGGSESMEAFGRFIVGLLRILAIQRSGTSKKSRTPTFLYVDEFQNFISDDIEKALTELRKYGLHLVFANQYAGQNIDTQLQKALFSTGLKIIGKNELKTAKSAGAEIEVNYEEIKNLNVGEFYIKNENYPALKVKVPTTLLGDNNAMSSSEWEEVKAHNLARYYVKTRQNKPRSNTAPQKEKTTNKLKLKPPKYSL